MSEFLPFHEVIALHALSDSDWEQLNTKLPQLARGWFELSRFSAEDRLEFTRAFWLALLPSRIEESIVELFDRMEEVGIYATQMYEGGPFDLHMTYMLQDHGGFFQGAPPASDEMIELLTKQFAHLSLPADYLAFLKIHNGLSRYTDSGVLPLQSVARTYQQLQQMLYGEMLVRPDGEVVNPAHLIPFYESHELHCFQCFYSDWYPDMEMGNIYFSTPDCSISNFLDNANLIDNLAFPSFVDWLLFYLGPRK